MPSGHLLGVSDKTYWDEALMHTMNTLERLHVVGVVFIICLFQLFYIVVKMI